MAKQRALLLIIISIVTILVLYKLYNTNKNKEGFYAILSVITTIAGTGAVGTTGDRGPATSATINAPRGIVLDSLGNIYIADSANHQIRMIAAGTTSPFPTLAPGPLVAGNIYRLAGSNTDATYVPSTMEGKLATLARFNQPHGIALDSSGNLYISNLSNRIFLITASTGIITTIAGTGAAGFTGDNGPATACTLNQPKAVALDPSGNVFICDYNNWRIRMIAKNTETNFFVKGPVTAGNIYTIAGNGIQGVTPGRIVENGIGIEPISPTVSTIQAPWGIAIDSKGNIYVSSWAGAIIVMIAGPSKINPFPTLIPNPIKPGFLYRVVGNGVINSSGPLATNTQTTAAPSLCIDSSGNIIYISYMGQKVEKVNAETGTISLIAGPGSVPGQSMGNTTVNVKDGGDPKLALFKYPYGIALDDSGNIYIADCFNCRIRKINTTSTCIPNAIDCISWTSFTCAAGYYSNAGACKACPQGSSCAAGGSDSAKTGLISFTCAAGNYSTSNGCSVCPVGSTCYTGGSAANQPGLTTFTCGPGYYSNAGSCSACPSNSSCGSGGSDASKTGLSSFTCLAGYSNSGSECVPCPPGWICSGLSNTMCGSNTFSLEKQTSCKPCQSNMYSDPGSGQCSYYRSTLPSYTQGSFQNMINLMPTSNVINCDQKNNCIYNWTTQFAKNTGPESANPCIGLNSWYDFDKRACVDTEGGTVTTTRCSSNSVYSPSMNICQIVRKPFIGQPLNTINSPSLTNPGDFGNCKTANEGDCTPYYMSSNGFVTKNPCILPSKYDFATRSCTKLNPCCGLTPNALTSNAACGTYVNKTTTYTVIPSKCPKGSTNTCCSTSKQTLPACATFWTKGTSNTYSPAYNKECATAGFEDYDGVDSMDIQRIKWMESM